LRENLSSKAQLRLSINLLGIRFIMGVISPIKMPYQRDSEEKCCVSITGSRDIISIGVQGDEAGYN